MKRTPNTDNKGHLFVTVFDHSAFYNVIPKSLNPDTAPVLSIKILHGDKFLAPLSVCTATLHQCSHIKLQQGDRFVLTLQPCTATLVSPRQLCHDGKNRDMASLHRDRFPACRDNIPAGCCVGQHKRPLLPGR